MYDVVVDGSVSTAVPSGQVLASVSALTTGYHNVTLIAKTSAPGKAPILLFECAVVTVGTGLTGAKVTRSIQQDVELVQYITHPASAWTTYSFDDYAIPHLPWNTTFGVLGGTSGSIIIPFSGHAVFVYGIGWSSIPPRFRASVDAQNPITLSPNWPIPSNSAGHFFSDNLLSVQFNPSGFSRTLTIDNPGHFGLDYIETVTVTGGSPFASQHNATLIAIVTVPVILTVIILFLCFLISFLERNRSDASSAAAVARMEGNLGPEDVVNLILDNENRESVRVDN